MTKPLPTVVALAVLAITGCSLPKPTPYQTLRHSNTGYDGVANGGYRDELMGPGQFMLVVEVNKYTDSATLIRYVHRRAGELCPTGYEFGSNLVERDGRGRSKASAVVICTTGER